MSGNSAARLNNISVKLTSECRRLFEDTDLKDNVQRIVKGGQEHVNTWNYLMRQCLEGINQQKEIIMKSNSVHDVNTSAVMDAVAKMMDFVGSAKNIESSYIRQIRECLEKCRHVVRRKQETIEVYVRNKEDLERTVRRVEETNQYEVPILQKEAIDFDTLANRLFLRARELDNMWFLTKVAMIVIGALLVTLTAGLILTVVAVAFLANFNLNTASGCRDGARACEQKATEKRNEIASRQSNIQSYQGKVTELQNMTDRVKSEIDPIYGIERDLNNLMQEIQSMNIQRSCDYVHGLLQNLKSRAATLSLFMRRNTADSEYRLQNFKHVNSCSLLLESVREICFTTIFSDSISK